MKSRFAINFVLVAAGFGLATDVPAAVLVEYQIPVSSTDHVKPSNVADHMSAENIAIAADTGTGVSTSSRTAFLRASDDSVSEAGAVGNNEYWQFELNADSGYELDLDAFSFDFGGSSTDGNFNTFWFVRTDLDSYTTTIGSKSVLVPSGGGSSYPDTMLDSLSIDLTGPTYQGLDSIIFRVYAYSDGASAQQLSRASQFKVEGDVVAVPEPASLALIGAGAMLMLPRRKQHA